MQLCYDSGSSYDCKCVGTGADDDNDDDYGDVILVLMLTVITWARWELSGRIVLVDELQEKWGRNNDEF